MENIKLPEIFKEFIELLNSNNVKYLLLGGWAVGYYGNPRATKDIDFFVSTDNLNLKNIKKVFLKFKSPPIDINILKEDNGVIFIGTPPIRIEILNTANGINFNECYKRKNIVKIDNINVNLISKEDLIKNKKSTKRLIDHSDAEMLNNIKINPNINTKDILKQKLIISNLVGAYGAELKEEKINMKIRKKDINYTSDLKIINKTILLYNKALKTKNKNDIFNIHKSFKINPINNEPYNMFKYKKLRRDIFNEIEYRYKLLLKNEYSYLNKKYIKNGRSTGGKK